MDLEVGNDEAGAEEEPEAEEGEEVGKEGTVVAQQAQLSSNKVPESRMALESKERPWHSKPVPVQR